MNTVITPKTRVEINASHTPIFLAGPVRCAPKWHDQAARYLCSHADNLAIAAPIREPGPFISQHKAPETSDGFERQRGWEIHYLEKAAREGCIIFWLPKAAEHNPEKLYSAITRIELGEWIAKLEADPSLGVVFGSDGGFHELRTLAYDIEHYAPGTPIYDSLAATCEAALKKAAQRRCALTEKPTKS